MLLVQYADGGVVVTGGAPKIASVMLIDAFTHTGMPMQSVRNSEHAKLALPQPLGNSPPVGRHPRFAHKYSQTSSASAGPTHPQMRSKQPAGIPGKPVAHWTDSVHDVLTYGRTEALTVGVTHDGSRNLVV